MEKIVLNCFNFYNPKLLTNHFQAEKILTKIIAFVFRSHVLEKKICQAKSDFISKNLKFYGKLSDAQ